MRPVHDAAVPLHPSADAVHRLHLAIAATDRPTHIPALRRVDLDRKRSSDGFRMTLRFSTGLRDAVFSHMGDRCEVRGCLGTADTTRLTVHHILFKCNRGLPQSYNAEVLCQECHAGGHCAVNKDDEVRRSGRGCVAASGVPMRVMFELLSAFELAELVQVRKHHSLVPDPMRPRRTRMMVVANEISGPGARAFDHCREMLSAILRATRRSGRFHAELERLVYRFVLDNYIPVESRPIVASRLGSNARMDEAYAWAV